MKQAAESRAQRQVIGLKRVAFMSWLAHHRSLAFMCNKKTAPSLVARALSTRCTGQAAEPRILGQADHWANSGSRSCLEQPHHVARNTPASRHPQKPRHNILQRVACQDAPGGRAMPSSQTQSSATCGHCAACLTFTTEIMRQWPPMPPVGRRFLPSPPRRQVPPCVPLPTCRHSLPPSSPPAVGAQRMHRRCNRPQPGQPLQRGRVHTRALHSTNALVLGAKPAAASWRAMQWCRIPASHSPTCRRPQGLHRGKAGHQQRCVGAWEKQGPGRLLRLAPRRRARRLKQSGGAALGSPSHLAGLKGERESACWSIPAVQVRHPA